MKQATERRRREKNQQQQKRKQAHSKCWKYGTNILSFDGVLFSVIILQWSNSPHSFSISCYCSQYIFAFSSTHSLCAIWCCFVFFSHFSSISSFFLPSSPPLASCSFTLFYVSREMILWKILACMCAEYFFSVLCFLLYYAMPRHHIAYTNSQPKWLSIGLELVNSWLKSKIILCDVLRFPANFMCS